MKRNKLITVLFLLFIITCAKGQDKIVTIQKDTIYCKIVSVSLNSISYEQNEVSKSILKTQVLEYSFKPLLLETTPGPLSTKKYSEEPASITKPQLRETISEPTPAKKYSEESAPVFSIPKSTAEPFLRWEVGVQIGGSNIMNFLTVLRQPMKDNGVPSQEVDDYYRQLQSGTSTDIDVHYMITRFMGLGLKYSLFSSSAQDDFIIKDSHISMPTYLLINKKDKIYLNYFGLSFLFQQWLNSDRTFRLSEELSVGYAHFRNETQFDPNQNALMNPDLNKQAYSYLGTGSALGGSAQLSLDYYPVSWLSFGVNAGVYPTSFGSLNITDNVTSVKKYFDEGMSLSMSRINYTFRLAFHF